VTAIHTKKLTLWISSSDPRELGPSNSRATPLANTTTVEITTNGASRRIGVAGGGCSGFQYSMSFENAAGMMDKIARFDDLKVFVDATSAMYLNGCTVDYVETLEAAGFKFENPNVKSTCGCGSSFNV